MKQKLSLITFALIAVLCVSACGDKTKEKLGLTRQSPDEFTVVKRAPLSVPPEFSLRPPEPGAPRPQEQSARQMARETLTGTQAAEKRDFTEAERAFLTRANALNADDSIRATINRETAEIIESSRPTAEKLGLIESGATENKEALDPMKEAERLSKEGAAERVVQPAPQTQP